MGPEKAAMQLEAGARIDARYVVHSLLGSGGMAKVYGARDERLGIDVALKVLTVPTASIRERLIQEGRVQASLQHPNLLNVTDIVDVGGSPGLVMPLVRGPSLDRLLPRHRLDQVEAEHMFRGIVSGVRRAHELGLIHRDLKPGNVLVERVGDQLVPRVADFGLAKLLADDSGTGTRSGMAMGTPRYMSPEQIRDAKHVDARADLFSLGAILYELLCARAAFVGEDTLQLFNAIAEGRWTRPSTLGLDLPDRLRDALNACLEPDRDARVSSCAELQAILDGEGGPPREAWRPETLEAVEDLAAPPAELGELGSSDTWTGSEASISAPASETLDFGAPEAPAEAAAAAPPPRRWGPWVAAAAGVGLLALVGVGWWSSRPAAVFTAAGPPPIADGPDVGRLLDSAWMEFLANEDLDALKHIDQAVALEATDPAVYLLGVALAAGMAEQDALDRYLADGVAASPNPTTPAGTLLHALQETSRQDAYASWDPVLEAHLATYPEDLLARGLRAILMEIRGQPGSVERVEGFIAADPEAALGYVMLAKHFVLAGDDAEALRVVARGLEHIPDSAALHGSRAHSLLALHRYDEALDAARASLRADPRWYPARNVGADAALAAGLPEEADRLAQPMLVDEIDPAMQMEFSHKYSIALFDRGRVRDAKTWWARAAAASEKSGELTNEVYRRTAVTNRARTPWLVSTADLEQAVADLDRALASPDFPANRRALPGYASQLAHAVLEARSGATPDPIEPEDPGRDISHLQVNAEIDAAARRWAALAEPHPDCRVALWRGMFSLDGGELEAARAHLEQAAADSACADRTGLSALTHAGLARVASKSGDRQRAHEELGALARDWPDPDPDLPILQILAREVSPEVLPAGALNAWLEGRERPLIVGLVPIEPLGVDPSVAQAVDMGLKTLLDGQPNARAVQLTDPDDPAGARVDTVVVGRVAAMGASTLLRMERIDAEGGAGGALLYQAEDTTAMGEHLEGALVVLLQDSVDTRNREAIGGVMSRYRPIARTCYEAALERDPEVEGRVALAWTIEPGGIPTGVLVVEDEVEDPELSACLVAQIENLVFPPGTQGMVQYPFDFAPVED